ncbi:HNH endonuclease signature motif containing protein [Lactobacillus sp. ESL0785]|uniref:HNH endonuclease n=1 Tax=Lactobacillus sp. ESL0785 TaxID=2983232 RepID=UPI0023F87134|nr:HNH endonuclease signature motif containing protein [Lactobacillus sp. ESL0785]WEV70965.1 HNH endonuclease signature motif containing protein [Lactobacillus sp. ESL0785]
MKFQCSSCGLRINSVHFKQQGLMNPKLTSICDICLQRGQDANDFANLAVQTFAQGLLYTFVGKSMADSEHDFLVNKKEHRKRYEAFIQDYDGNSLAQQQLSRHDFNAAVIASESGQTDFVPQIDLTFAENLERLGLQVNFQLNEVDYIDRERIRAKYHYRCQYCGRRGRSVDHKDPVSLSHNNDFANLILSCQECNKIKSNMPYDLFTKLNEQIKPINQKLVKYENALATLQGEFEERRRKLAATAHLKGVVNDPELNALRKQNKKLQDAIDSLASDYRELRLLREQHFMTGWKLAEEQKTPDII